jgi:hypothetical protein
MSSINFWLAHVIDAYLEACARGEDWRKAVADAEQQPGDKPLAALTQKDLKQKGIPYSRQHIERKVKAGTFPAPFKLPEIEAPDPDL